MMHTTPPPENFQNFDFSKFKDLHFSGTFPYNKKKKAWWSLFQAEAIIVLLEYEPHTLWCQQIHGQLIPTSVLCIDTLLSYSWLSFPIYKQFSVILRATLSLSVTFTVDWTLKNNFYPPSFPPLLSLPLLPLFVQSMLFKIWNKCSTIHMDMRTLLVKLHTLKDPDSVCVCVRGGLGGCVHWLSHQGLGAGQLDDPTEPWPGGHQQGDDNDDDMDVDHSRQCFVRFDHVVDWGSWHNVVSSVKSCYK